MSHIRVDCPDVMAQTGRVVFVDDDGHDTDISSCVRGFTVNGQVDAPTWAKLDVVKVKVNLAADVEHVLLDWGRPADEQSA